MDFPLNRTNSGAVSSETIWGYSRWGSCCALKLCDSDQERSKVRVGVHQVALSTTCLRYVRLGCKHAYWWMVITELSNLSALFPSS